MEDKDGRVPVWYLNRDTPLSTVKLLDFPVKKFDKVSAYINYNKGSGNNKFWA